jgi:hypothetical protein
MNVRKQLESSWHKFRTAHRWHTLLSPSILLVMGAFVIFLATLFWMPPYSAQGSGEMPAQLLVLTAQATPQVRVEPTRTPFPEEFLTNGQQTIGITFAGAVLVLIVVIGVIVYIPRKVDDRSGR